MFLCLCLASPLHWSTTSIPKCGPQFRWFSWFSESCSWVKLPAMLVSEFRFSWRWLVCFLLIRCSAIRYKKGLLAHCCGLLGMDLGTGLTRVVKLSNMIFWFLHVFFLQISSYLILVAIRKWFVTQMFFGFFLNQILNSLSKSFRTFDILVWALWFRLVIQQQHWVRNVPKIIFRSLKFALDFQIPIHL